MLQLRGEYFLDFNAAEGYCHSEIQTWGSMAAKIPGNKTNTALNEK